MTTVDTLENGLITFIQELVQVPSLPGKCVTLAGNPLTAQKIEKIGVELHTYPRQEISLKGTGGPTCLTCPILR